MSEELDRLFTLKVAKAVEEFSATLQEESIAKAGDLARRGIRGGAQINLAMNLALKRVDGILRVKLTAFKDVYGKAGLLTPESIRDFGKKQVENITGKQIEGHIRNSPVTKGIEVPNISDRISRDVEQMKSRFLRDVEIDAASLEVQPEQPLSASGSSKGPQFRFDVFISFASPDKAVAESVAKALTDRGLKVYFSPKQLKGGDHWEENIRSALVDSRELCLIVSHESLPREWVLTEWGAAWATQKRITPVLVDCSVSDLPDRLRFRQCIMFSDIDLYATEAAARVSDKPAG